MCSLPPIINSEHSKVKLTTRNVFIEVTAVDRTKLEIVNHIMVAMFSQYCDPPFVAEPVRIESAHNGASRVTPDLAPRDAQAELAYTNDCCGLDLSAAEACRLLTRMGYEATEAGVESTETRESGLPPQVQQTGFSASSQPQVATVESEVEAGPSGKSSQSGELSKSSQLGQSDTHQASQSKSSSGKLSSGKSSLGKLLVFCVHVPCA